MWRCAGEGPKHVRDSLDPWSGLWYDLSLL